MITNGNGRADDSMKIIDIAKMLGEQEKAIEQVRSQSTNVIRIIVGLMAILLIPVVGAFVEAGRLIERIEDLSQSVREIGHDHEARIRVIEKAL